MLGGKVIIHFNDAHELFNDVDFNNTTVEDLLNCARRRFYEEFEDLFAGFSDCLCEGPYVLQPLDDLRLREIVEMVQQLMPPGNVNEELEMEQGPIHLWLCNCNKIIFVRLNHLLIFYDFFC
jgi:hypothetical protein